MQSNQMCNSGLKQNDQVQSPHVSSNHIAQLPRVCSTLLNKHWYNNWSSYI
jgi:hypothetical protein